MARRKKGNDINGWLIIDKPKGITSNGVVNITRRLFNANKNGHGGTLDPFATGVLPVAFGEATKLIPFIMDGKKEYEFVVRWGETTDTGDSEGQIVERNENLPSKEEIEKVLPTFIGKITQVPPAYSAIKINGERAYNLARQGQEVDMPSREVDVYALELLETISPKESRFRVECGKGTYVRTLGKDIALALGTVGYLTELRRTKCSSFSISDTILLENLENMVYKDELMLPVIAYLRDIAVIAVSEEDAAKLKQGQRISPRSYEISELIDSEGVAMFEGSLVAIVRIEEKRISPVRVFNL